MPKCLSCARGFLNECRGGDCNSVVDELGTPDTEVSEDEDNDEPKEKRYRRTKPDAALKDQQSTGRKRAARMYKLHPDQPCEWRGKVNMGGGVGIVGCFDGMQQARHHGPDKNTLNNDPGNVHRICHFCHNGWHAKNDPNYDPNAKLRD